MGEGKACLQNCKLSTVSFPVQTQGVRYQLCHVEALHEVAGAAVLSCTRQGCSWEPGFLGTAGSPWLASVDLGKRRVLKSALLFLGNKEHSVYRRLAARRRLGHDGYSGLTYRWYSADRTLRSFPVELHSLRVFSCCRHKEYSTKQMHLYDPADKLFFFFLARLEINRFSV